MKRLANAWATDRPPATARIPRRSRRPPRPDARAPNRARQKSVQGRPRRPAARFRLRTGERADKYGSPCFALGGHVLFAASRSTSSTCSGRILDRQIEPLSAVHLWERSEATAHGRPLDLEGIARQQNGVDLPGAVPALTGAVGRPAKAPQNLVETFPLLLGPSPDNACCGQAYLTAGAFSSIF